MTKNILITGINNRRCELCEKIEDCRPYGPNGKWVCFECGMKDQKQAIKEFFKLIDVIE